jgi:uncharacterized protein (TIGR02147 family)
MAEKEHRSVVMERPVVYDYLDYRAFLKEMVAYNKQKRSNFSYRAFSRVAGFKSPNFLQLVISGQRNLTNESIAKITKGFALKKQEREFFENMVFMNQAKSHEEKDHYYKKMRSARGYTKINRLEKEQYEYFSRWYYPVIRELVTLGKADYPPEKLAAMLKPGISTAEVARAVTLLERLRMIKRDKNGKWVQCDRIITPGPDIQSLILINLHKELLRISMEALDRFPAEQREFNSMILSTTKKNIPVIKEKMKKFRDEILELISEDSQPDQVIQLNLQLFPLAGHTA